MTCCTSTSLTPASIPSAAFGPIGISLTVGCVILAVVIAHGCYFKWRSARSRVIGLVALLLGLAPVAFAVYMSVSIYGPRPQPTTERLFLGVQYIREVTEGRQPSVVHILRVDLSTEGVSVLVTPPEDPDSDLPLRKRTTSQFVEEFDLQAAINGINFHPFNRDLTAIADIVTNEPARVLGSSASQGVEYGKFSPVHPMLHISEDNHATIAMPPPRPWYNAITGIKHFIVDGKPIRMTPDDEPFATTTVGINRTGRVLYLVVVDGEQPPYSTGLDRPALTQILLSHRVYNAMALDSGGSSTMVVEGPDGGARLVNQPINGGVPGVQRAVGNHLGIRAKRFDR